MYKAVACFWLESTDHVRVALRRYSSAGSQCTMGYHQAYAPLGDVTLRWMSERPEGVEGADHWTTGPDGAIGIPDFVWPDDSDVRWPTHCQCGYIFQDSDERQHFWDRLYRRGDTGELVTLRDAPPGAMWDAEWYPWKGPDGRSVVARCPNGQDWMIDGRATNCTLPDDDEHRCWVRHGEPPNITVDKNGFTCAAGAGSILAGDYHGFLRDGIFTDG